MEPSKVTAIVINRNRPEETTRCVESLKNQSAPIDIVVHDNSELNLGVALPSNIEAKKCNTEYIFFIDNDAYLPSNDYVERLLKVMEFSDKCVFCFGRVTNPDGSDQWIELFNLKSPDEIQKCDWFNGCGVLIRRDVFVELGGYNPYFFAYYLEPELAARMYKAGYYGMYVPVRLVHEQTMKQRNVSTVNYLLIRNGLLFNLREGNWIKVIRRLGWGMFHADFATFMIAIEDTMRMVWKNGRNHYY